jgi:hypothetical protein
MATWVKEFKSVRHLMVQDFYQLLPLPMTIEDWDAVAFVSYDGDQAVVFAFAGASGGTRQVALQGLNLPARYTVTRRPNGESMTMQAAQLLDAGLTITLESYGAGMWTVVTSG